MSDETRTLNFKLGNLLLALATAVARGEAIGYFPALPPHLPPKIPIPFSPRRHTIYEEMPSS